MKWWKKALIGSAIWMILLGIGVFFMMQHINREAVSPETRDALETKAGEIISSLFVFGLAAIWGIFWSRQRQKAIK